eukprot:m.136418 g.136418  ORF g.136418 m.136418 type:complete len:830 (-) comp13943_c0_seq1:293-2782(-)
MWKAVLSCGAVASGLTGSMGTAAPPASIKWVNAAPFVSNTGFNTSVPRPPYGRLPTAAQTGSLCPTPCPVRADVWAEGLNGAGLFLAFQSNSPTIWLNASLIDSAGEDVDCSATCGSGLDMYAWDPATRAWRWISTTTASFGGGWALSGPQITRSMTPTGAFVKGMVRYRIHLPIYNGLTSAQIGVAPASVLTPMSLPPTAPPPILFYGTSIVNGHVASRPGMIFTAQLARKLNRSVVNLGFGGNGKMEPAIGAVIASMKELALVVVDCNYNMAGSDIEAAAIALVKQLRAEWSPTKPVVLAEGPDNGAKWIVPTMEATQQARRAALSAAYTSLTQAGVPNLHYVLGEDLIGVSGAADIPTAMGTHPTDLGHAMIAEFYEKELPPILDGTAVPRPIPVRPVASSVAPPTTLMSAEGAADGNIDSTININRGITAPGDTGDTGGTGGVRDGASTGDACGQPDAIAWTVARTSLTVGGRAPWDNLPRENFYDRFPLASKGNVTSEGAREGIWGLSKCSTGMFIEFAVQGNVSMLYVNYSVFDSYGHNPSGGNLSIMPPLGRRGVDLYGQSALTGEWVWAGNYASSPSDHSAYCGGLSTAGALDTAAATRFMLYLPLWRACSDDLSIGITSADYTKGGRIVPSSGAIDASKPPVVWYGTSIVHGAAVTRAGESFTNRVSRALNRTIYNFGFSGSGHMDLGIGLWLAKIPAAAYIIDCNWNMGAAEIAEKTGPIVRQLRAARPSTPIVLAEGTPAGSLWFGGDQSQAANNAALRKAFGELTPTVPNLHYVHSASLYAASGSEVSPTVGGTHPSDLGAHDVAAFYASFLPGILG